MIKISIIGKGRMALEHLKALKQIKKINITAVLVRSKKKNHEMPREFSQLKIYDDLEKMISLENPDGIVVAVTETSLHSLFRKLVEYKIPLLIEKPIGLNLNENLKILNLTKKYKKKNCYVALNRRYYSSTNSLLKLLAKDRKSKRKIYISDQQYNLKKFYPHKEKAVIQNMMYANSVHLIDYINILARGKVGSIVTNLTKIKKNIFHIYAVIKFSSGDIVYYKAVWNNFSRWGVRIFTNNFFYEKSPLEELQYFNIKELKIKKVKIHNNDKKFKPGFMSQALDFVNMIQKKNHRLVSVEDNFNTTKIINKIYEKL